MPAIYLIYNLVEFQAKFKTKSTSISIEIPNQCWSCRQTKNYAHTHITIPMNYWFVSHTRLRSYSWAEFCIVSTVICIPNKWTYGNSDLCHIRICVNLNLYLDTNVWAGIDAQLCGRLNGKRNQDMHLVRKSYARDIAYTFYRTMFHRLHPFRVNFIIKLSWIWIYHDIHTPQNR